MFCPNCGHQLPDDAKFCLNCGHSLSGKTLPKEDGPSPSGKAARRADYEKDDFIEAQPARRPIWPWIITAVFSALAVGVILYLLLGGSFGGTAAPISAPAAPDAAPAQQAPAPDPGTPSPAPVIGAISPSPTTQIIVITPAPPTASPVPSVPDAVKVFYMTKELDEFTEAQGNTLTLVAEVYPVADFCNMEIQWTVSDPSVIKLQPAAFGRTCDVTILKVSSGPVTMTVSCCGAKKDVKVYTKSASAPSPKPGPMTLDKNTLYRINIFLSNFSEQQVKPFTAATCADDYLLRVVELYCKINHNSLISYSGGDECLSLADANTYMNRFFGRTVNPPEGASYLLDAWNEFKYSGGYFRFPAADGGSFNRFTVAREMTANTDGTYTVEFQVFELDITEYWDKGMDSGLYWLSNDDVAALVSSKRVKPVQGGTAIVKDFKFNSVDTYQIIKYDVWDLKG